MCRAGGLGRSPATGGRSSTRGAFRRAAGGPARLLRARASRKISRAPKPSRSRPSRGWMRTLRRACSWRRPPGDLPAKRMLFLSGSPASQALRERRHCHPLRRLLPGASTRRGDGGPLEVRSKDRGRAAPQNARANSSPAGSPRSGGVRFHRRETRTCAGRSRDRRPHPVTEPAPRSPGQHPRGRGPTGPSGPKPPAPRCAKEPARP